MEPLWLFIALIVAAVALAAVCVIIFIVKNNECRKKYEDGRNDGLKEGYEKKTAEVDAAIGGAEQKAQEIISEAEKKGERKKRDFLIQARDEIQNSRTNFEKEIKDKREEVQKKESRLNAKEENLDKKLENLEKRENALKEEEESVKTKKAEADLFYQKQEEELQKIAGMTVEEAKEKLLADLDEELTHEKAAKIREYETKLNDEKQEMAKNVIATAVQQCAADYVSEVSITLVPIPSEEMKGRIIGRSGRNINAIETATGVDLVIDDTPDAVILSCFNPIRREIARIALEKLIADGRIHPGKIEEVVEKARKEVDAVIRKEGENAAYEAGVYGLNAEIIKLLGRMKYRTSYTQSVLIHSIEVSKLSGIMAAELGADVDLARRAGLLHDIGKAVDFETQGTHIELGAEIARKYKENDVVINAIMSHHGDVEPTSVISVIVAAADAISAARPGARNEPLESYVKRIEKLEGIANSFKGVDSSKTFAIQAGREIRVAVLPDKVSDDEMVVLSRDIARKIESEMQYPGQIKVTVIREKRATDCAK